MALYSVKMRASSKINGLERHISGAERIVRKEEVEACVASLQARAFNHPKGIADLVNIKIESIQEEEIIYVNSLPVSTIDVSTKEAGLAKMTQLLSDLEIKNSQNIIDLLQNTAEMRGAILLDVHSGRRLEADLAKGIRVTYMDYESGNFDCNPAKHHFKEALALASKVLHHPHIVAELCVSDDPAYVIGYLASKKHGYVRITKVKSAGSPYGSRIFLYDGPLENVEDCIHFLEKEKVLIRDTAI